MNTLPNPQRPLAPPGQDHTTAKALVPEARHGTPLDGLVTVRLLAPAANDKIHPPAKQPESIDAMLLSRLNEILSKRQLNPLFQPIIHMQNGEIVGYEGLIRGPSDSPLHSPMNLFKVARANNLGVEIEHLCRRVILERFAELKLPGRLFLNVSPEMLLPEARRGETLAYIREVGLNPERVIIELTENQPTYDYELMREAVMHYRSMGFRIAIDDLGEGFSSLRLWSELRPEYVKIDMHFVQGINHDPVKLQFVRSIQEIAEESGTIVIAEGIETQTELLLIRDLGIACGQGYHIARPHANPGTELPAEVAAILNRDGVSIYPQKSAFENNIVTALKLLRVVPTVTPDMSNIAVYDVFRDNPELEVIPVVQDGMPLGLITRPNLFDRFARLYLRELYGRKPCTVFMDAKPLVTDKDTSLSLGVVRAEPGQFVSHHQIASAASDAKKQAKKIPGHSLFIERRQGSTLPDWSFPA